MSAETEIHQGYTIGTVADGAIRAEWAGRGAADLGLVGPVNDADLARTYAPVHLEVDDDEFDMDDPKTVEALNELRQLGLINY